MDAQERLPSLFIIPLVLFLVMLALFIALLNGQTELALLSLLVLGMAGGAKLWARLSLARMSFSVKIGKERLFPGEILTLNMEIVNRKLLPVWFQVKVPAEGLLGMRPQGKLSKESGLLWYQRVLLNWELVARKRGVYEIGPFRLRAGDLFGFFSSRKEMEKKFSVIVYPKIVPLRPVRLSRQDLFGIPGAKSPVKDPVYVLGTHDYQSWQPSKYIHWKASARHSRLQAKVFEPSAQEKVLLAVQVDRFARENAEAEFERALEVTASLAVKLDQQGYAVGLVTNGVLRGGGTAVVPVARDPRQLPTILEVLARLQMEPQRDVISLLRERTGLLWNTACVYFAYEEDEASRHIESYFGSRRIPVVFVLCRGGSHLGGKGERIRQKIHHIDEVYLT